jgi:hypothetical protein
MTPFNDSISKNDLQTQSVVIPPWWAGCVGLDPLAGQTLGTLMAVVKAQHKNDEKQAA